MQLSSRFIDKKNNLIRKKRKAKVKIKLKLKKLKQDNQRIYNWKIKSSIKVIIKSSLSSKILQKKCQQLIWKYCIRINEWNI